MSFRGRIYFRRYITNKRHGYGIKVVGYTYSFKLLTDMEERSDDISFTLKIVTDLMDDHLNLCIPTVGIQVFHSKKNWVLVVLQR